MILAGIPDLSDALTPAHAQYWDIMSAVRRGDRARFDEKLNAFCEEHRNQLWDDARRGRH